MVLLEELHRRIFEDEEFGYWRTHPYFTDRVARARAAAGEIPMQPDSTEELAYRRDLGRRLSVLAALRARRADRHLPATLRAARRLRQRVVTGGGARPAAHARRPDAACASRSSAPTDRWSPTTTLSRRAPPGSPPLRASRRDCGRSATPSTDSAAIRYEQLKEILARENAGTPFLELFLANFPDDPEAPAVGLRLAERYRLTDRADAAALALARTADDDPAARRALREVLPQTKELRTAGKILHDAKSDSVRQWASARLEAQAAALDSLELGSRFLQEFPDAEVSGRVRGRWRIWR